MKASFYKKTLSFILSLLMLCLSLGTVAFASGDSKVLEDDSALTPSVFQEQAAAQDAYSKLCASFKLTEDGSYVSLQESSRYGRRGHRITECVHSFHGAQIR